MPSAPQCRHDLTVSAESRLATVQDNSRSVAIYLERLVADVSDDSRGLTVMQDARNAEVYCG